MYASLFSPRRQQLTLKGLVHSELPSNLFDLLYLRCRRRVLRSLLGLPADSLLRGTEYKYTGQASFPCCYSSSDLDSGMISRKRILVIQTLHLIPRSDGIDSSTPKDPVAYVHPVRWTRMTISSKVDKTWKSPKNTSYNMHILDMSTACSSPKDLVMGMPTKRF